MAEERSTWYQRNKGSLTLVGVGMAGIAGGVVITKLYEKYGDRMPYKEQITERIEQLQKKLKMYKENNNESADTDN